AYHLCLWIARAAIPLLVRIHSPLCRFGIAASDWGNGARRNRVPSLQAGKGRLTAQGSVAALARRVARRGSGKQRGGGRSCRTSADRGRATTPVAVSGRRPRGFGRLREVGVGVVQRQEVFGHWD